MKPTLPPLIERYRIQLPGYEKTNPGDIQGAFQIPYRNRVFRVVCGVGFGWDHLSVSLKTRCPTWGEMCHFKDMWFHREETVIQYHPPRSQYINHHPNALHMWRPWDVEIPLPPDWMIA